MFYKNLTIFNLCQKKNYIILNFNYPMVNTFSVIFLNQKVRFILNLNHKVSLSILPTTFWTTKKEKTKTKKKQKNKKTYSTKDRVWLQTGLLLACYNSLHDN